MTGTPGKDDVEQLYVYGETLNAATDKSQNEKDYKGILAAATGSTRAKLLAAQLIPRFFKHFQQLSAEGINAQLDLCEDDDLQIRIQAVRGLPYLCRDTPEHLPKLADVLCQLLIAEEEQEHTIVQNALMQVVRQNPKDSLAAVFKHVDSSEDNVREKVIRFMKDKIFPNKGTILSPPDKMERHIADLIKGLHDVTGDEFQMLLAFLRTLHLFGEKAPPARMQELAEIVEGQADLDSEFKVEDADHIERVMACFQMAVPFYARGAASTKFIQFINKHVLPAFDKLAEDKKMELLKNLAESSAYTAPSDARAILPTIVDLSKKLMPREKSEDLNFAAIECLLYTFHQLAHKVPNATNPLCGYKAYTGQPSDRLGEDFSKANEDWLKRLSVVEEAARKQLKQLMAGMAEHTKEEKAAADEAAKADVRAKKALASQLLRACTNIEKMAKVLHAKIPSFMNTTVAPTPSWKTEASAAAKPVGKPIGGTSSPQTGAKRQGAAANGAAPEGGKRHRPGSTAASGGQLASKALQGIGVGQGQGREGGGPPRAQKPRRRPWRRIRK